MSDIRVHASTRFVAAPKTRHCSGFLMSATRESEAEIRRLGRLVQEQAALRRIATLVAQGAPLGNVFAVAAEVIARVSGIPSVSIARYEADGTATEFVANGTPSADVRSTVDVPILVDGRIAGAVIIPSTDTAPAPVDAAARLTDFTELLGTAITSGQARAELRRLAEEQAALRHVATLVAQGAEPNTVFTAVAVKAAQVLRVGAVSLLSYDAGTQTFTKIFGTHGERSAVPDGTQSRVADCPEGVLVVETGQAARIDDWSQIPGLVAARHREFGFGQAIAAPIVVNSTIWGYIGAYAEADEILPPESERRLADFTNLMATALANVQARDELRGLAEEQAALRRVATMVARERPAEEVFACVAEEVRRLVQAEAAAVWRYCSDGDAIVVGSWGTIAKKLPVGRRVKLDGDSVAAMILRTQRPARFDEFQSPAGSIAAAAHEVGVRSAVGGPILVDGALWGSIVAGTSSPTSMPADAEARIAQFTELAATAISNLQVREALAASRARVIATGDEQRRRVVRDLHDGAQQRLVHTIVTLKMARKELERYGPEAAALVDEPLEHATRATNELRELAHGILPTALTRGGLHAGISELVSTMSIPVQVAISVQRTSPDVEATAYFVVAEALTNVAKHAHAHSATVRVHLDDGNLQLEVRDDGVGGAKPDGTGLVGLSDRLAVHNGTLRVESPPHGGTVVAASIPVA
ncbi:GAF domain-containing protein [Solirubrobacter ginsenosidimutans]|uniref:histidine kinase n=1 Tax=Solirubrobacter ginsenosidimutans TaxID=490573 RepID=A0A9X3N0J8_9ACTN|nr:GAF domain-containing protein [Solirubrobacter ginsenosidimutans]MDA0166002.1 GAF domain-containing protein [Solirubrobacter ginsenosidimutans]